ncbi:MAG: Na(+)/H(+) antiporter subunit D [Rhodospirillaceae bacterium]
MSAVSLPPALLLIIGGLLLPFLPARARPVVSIMLPLATLWAVWAIPDGPSLVLSFLDRYALEPVEADAVGRVFATVFALAGLGGVVFGFSRAESKETAAALVYCGGAIGCCFAGDWITLFIFWELMALASTLVIWSSDQPGAAKAGFRYILLHLLGGVILMAGITGQVVQTGTTDLVALELGSVASWLILVGLLINAGAPPFCAWVADAYPEGSVFGTVFLSAFTTKTAVLLLWRAFPGTEILIAIGVFMVIYGIIYALLENDIRRLLSFSIINQVGFMIVGIGIGTELALNGAAAHAFAHILYKAALLMSAGSVMYMTGGLRKATELGGLYRSMPITATCGIIGALAISSFPFTSGFVSKTMITAATADAHLLTAWLFLEAASACAFLYIGLKFPWLVFFGKDSGLRPPDPPWPMKGAMIAMAALCILIGLFPGVLYSMLPFPVDYSPYSGAKISATLQLLLFAGLAFWLLRPILRRTPKITLDMDWLYRKPGLWLGKAILGAADETKAGVVTAGMGGIRRLLAKLEDTHGMSGSLGHAWSIGGVMTAVFAVMALYLLNSYL